MFANKKGDFKMVDLIIRQKVSDYGKWRQVFDGSEDQRRSYGATGVKQIYRDAKDSNIITVITEWDKAENAQKFAREPVFADLRKKGGVIGEPIVAEIVSPA
jgi:hypothetical protein